MRSSQEFVKRLITRCERFQVLTSRYVVRLLLTVAIILNPFLFGSHKAWALEEGPYEQPCDLLTEGVFQNTINCQNGACIGSIHILPPKYGCTGGELGSCTDIPDVGAIDYSAKPVDLGLEKWAECHHASQGCVACLITAGALAFVPGIGWVADVGVGAVCGVVCGIGWWWDEDACCWTACQQDLTTRLTYPGGQSC